MKELKQRKERLESKINDLASKEEYIKNDIAQANEKISQYKVKDEEKDKEKE